MNLHRINSVRGFRTQIAALFVLFSTVFTPLEFALAQTASTPTSNDQTTSVAEPQTTSPLSSPPATASADPGAEIETSPGAGSDTASPAAQTPVATAPNANPSAAPNQTESTDQSGQTTAPDNATQATSPAASDGSTAKPLDSSAGSTISTPTDTSNSKKPPAQPLALGPTGGGGGDPHSDDQRKAIGTEALFQPDPLAGALNYSYPLTLPPGRNKLTPDLSLNYGSQPGANVNTFGYGWSVSIPSITRINKTGTDALYGQDYYYSSLDGELASSSPGVYGPIAETGSFNKYVFSTSTNSWRVTDKFGTVYTFGSTTSSRLDNPGNSNQIYQWMLDKVTDTNSNYIKYAYYKDSGEIYPNQVIYTGNGTTDGPFEVDFLRTSRNDAATSSQPGFPIHSNYLTNEVDVKVSGTWVRKYLLGFTTGDNQTRSLLNSITEEGQDDVGGTITLPPVTFAYQQSNPGWVATSTWNAPTYFTDYQTQSNGGDVGVRVVDVNGDGLPDVLMGYKSADGSYTNLSAWINTGAGWVASSTWNPPIYFNDRTYSSLSGDNGVRIVDINGDGLPDIIQSYKNSDGTASSTQTWINTGAGWVASSTWNPPIFITNYSYSQSGDIGTRLIDINGDGLPDIVQSVRDVSQNVTTNVLLNNGAGWTATTTWTIPAYFADYYTQPNGDIGVRVADVNGDGLPDILQGDRSADGNTTISHAWINNGHGWTLDDTYAPPVPFVAYNSTDKGDFGVRFMDVNGDGLQDMVQSFQSAFQLSSSTNAWLNTGHGWQSSPPWSPPMYIDDYFYTSNGDMGVRDSDVDGNNLPELLKSLRDGLGSTTVITYAANSKKADLLSSITNITGGATSYTYKQSPLYTSGSSQLNSHLPVVLDTVSTVTSDDGLGTKATTTYAYSGGSLYYATPFDHKLAGFNKITATDNAGNYTNTYYHTGSGADGAHGEYQDSKAKIGEAYRTENYDPSNNLYAKQITRWGQIALGNNRFFVAASTTVSAQYDGSASHRDKAESYTYDPTYGNLTQKMNYGEVSGNDDGTFSDIGSDLASTSISYATNTTAYIVGLPADELTQDQGSNKVRETRHYFDGLSLGSVNIGNETKTESWITGSTYASTTKVYDGTYGLVTQSRDADGNLTTNTFDANNLYVATSTNALSQATGYTYDHVNGKVKNTFDPNSHLFTTTYDALRRPLTVSEPDPTSGALVAKTAYTYTDSNTPGSTSVEETNYLNAATTTNTYTYFDGLARNLQQRKTANGVNTYAVKDWTYNNLGLLNSESLPYFASSTARSTATSTNALFTTYSYDPLLRVSKITNAIGSTTNAYSNWTVTTTDPDGHVKDYTRDAYGNLASVVEHLGTNATTTYAWDLNGDLTNITDALANIRNFTYDGLGRRLTAQDLHASGDATFGSWSYAYDKANNLTQTVDPKNQTINYGYDVLNRVTSEDYTGQAGTEVTYVYDSCSNGKGRLCVATTTADATIASTYSYNPLGLIASEKKQINGSQYTTSYSYDRQGNQTDIIYPDQSEVFYTFGPQNTVQGVQQREGSAYPWATLVSSVAYSPLGQESQIVLGSGATTTNTYDPNSLYRLTRKVTILPDSGDWGTGVSGNPFGFITSNSSPNASWTSAATPPNVSTNLNTENLWLSNSISYQDSFENGTSTWIFYPGSAVASSSIDCTTSFTGACSYKVSVASTSWQSIPQVMQILRIDPNTNYTVKYRMKASATTTVEADIQANHDTYAFYGLDKNPTVTPSWQEHSYYFSSTATTTDKNARLLFALGSAHADTYWIDDVELIPEAVSTVRSPGFENITPGNDWTTYFQTGGTGNASVDCSTPTTEGSCSEKINVLQASPNNWYVQLQQPQSFATTTYLLTFDAKASIQRTGDVYLNQNHAPGNQLTPTVHFNLFPNWSHYEIELGPTGDPLGRIIFSLDQATSTIWIDNVHFFAKQNTKFTGTPRFTGIYDSTGSSTASAYQIQLIQKGGSWSSPLWDSGKTTLSPQTQIGARTATSTYAGSTLANGTKYYWRMMVWDNNNNPSPWTNGNDFFFTPGNRVQDLSYTYDPVGNITHLVDASFTKSAKAVDYTYDNLNRLIQASTTPDASSGAPNAGHNMIEKWSYDLLGNILTDATTTLSGSWATTTYAYTGNTGSLTANPDAATQIGNTTLTYDGNGNQLTGLNGLEESWDWRNRMSYSLAGTTTSYAYDENNERVRMGTDADVFHYPNDFYSLDTGLQIPTRHVFLNGKDIVTITGATSSDSVACNFIDSLNSTGVTADKNNRVQEVTDYTPYGALNNHDQLAGYAEQRKYIGQPLDADTNLSYLSARYYNATQGQFLSEDPVFWGKQNIADPQSLNSYFYASGNPVTKSDPSGLLTFVIPGTAYNPKDWSNGGSASGFISGVGKTFGETPVVINNKAIWSGADNSAARAFAAQVIAGAVAQYKFAQGEKLNIVGFSHGGNIGIDVSQMTSHKIDNLVTIGTPVRSDYQPNYSMIGTHIQAYSNNDNIWQGMGGGETSGSQVFGSILFGLPGWVMGGMLDWGEFGPAGHEFPGAKNIDETNTVTSNPKEAHGALWSTPQVWTDISQQISTE